MDTESNRLNYLSQYQTGSEGKNPGEDLIDRNRTKLPGGYSAGEETSKSTKEQIREAVEGSPFAISIVSLALGFLTSYLAAGGNTGELFGRSQKKHKQVPERVSDSVKEYTSNLQEMTRDGLTQATRSLSGAGEQLRAEVSKRPKLFLGVGIGLLAASSYLIASKLRSGVANTNSRTEQSAEQGSYEDRSREELYDRARELDIPGRSNMTKGELVEALRTHH